MGQLRRHGNLMRRAQRRSREESGRLIIRRGQFWWIAKHFLRCKSAVIGGRLCGLLKSLTPGSPIPTNDHRQGGWTQNPVLTYYFWAHERGRCGIRTLMGNWVRDFPRDSGEEKLLLTLHNTDCGTICWSPTSRQDFQFINLFALFRLLFCCWPLNCWH